MSCSRERVNGTYCTYHTAALVDNESLTCVLYRDTWESVLEHMKSARAFMQCNREAIDCFLQHGVEKTEDGKRFRLVVSPAAEAVVYCHTFIEFSTEIFDRAQCKMVIEHAERTPFFRPTPARRLTEQLPGKFILSD